MMRTFYLVLTITLIYFTSAKLLFPENLFLHVRIHGRLETEESYDGVVQLSNNMLSAIINSDESQYLYSSGRMITTFHMENNIDTRKICGGKDVPPYVNIKQLLSHAKLLETKNTFDREVNQCTHKRWLINYSGENFVVCQNHNGKLERIVGRNVIIEILEYKIGEIYLNHQLISAQVNHCPEYHQNVEIRNTKYWFEEELTCSLDWLKDEKVCNLRVLKKQEKKVCIFLHGVGQYEHQRGDPVPEFPDYWGNVHKFTPQCSKRIFIREETKMRGWTNEDLQKEYCRVALMDQPKSDQYFIRNKVLFVHSMGNLVLAAAIKNKFCDIDNKTTSWYDVTGPFGGTKAVPFVDFCCSYNGTGWRDSLYRYVADVSGYCHNGTIWPAYRTLAPGFEGKKELLPIMQARVSGNMCGESAFGLNSKLSLVLKIVSEVVDYGEPNDGLIPFSSCNVKTGKQYKPDYNENYYLGSINHADATCRHGDGWWGSERKPCSYYTNKL